MTTENEFGHNSNGKILRPDVAPSAQAKQTPSINTESASVDEEVAPNLPRAAPSSGKKSVDPLPRRQRYLDFAEFGNVGEQRFKELCNADKDAREFDRHYSFYAVSKGRRGGTDKRAFEVFFGNRPFDVARQGPLGQGFRTLTERGASLSYYQDDRGRVHCILRPASSEGMLPVENAVELKTVVEPRELLDGRLLESHFRDLVAYMQCTSLDGDPGPSARFRIGWLRLSRRLAIDNRWQPTRFSVILREIGKYVATIGLSGFLLFGIQAWIASKDSEPKTVLIGGESPKIQSDRALILETIEQQKELLLQLNERDKRFSDSLRSKATTPKAKIELPRK